MNPELNILVALPMTKARQALLQKAAPAAHFTFTQPGHATPEQVAAADILVGLIPADLCRYAQKAVWYQSNAAGPDAYLKKGVFPHKVRITSAIGAYGPSVGEHMLALTLALQKNLELYRDREKMDLWQDAGPAGTMYHAAVLVLGLGDIGGTYARYAAAMGAVVTGYRRHQGVLPDGVQKIISTPGELEEHLPRADVVAMCLPGGEATYHLMNEARLRLMKPTAVLVNCGRGTCVDNDALAAVLHEQKIFGAAVDVTEPEPLPAGHPLWKEPRAIITPHIAGFFHIEETCDRICTITAENLRHFLRQEPLRNEMT